jgi:hypothetical protein
MTGSMNIKTYAKLLNGILASDSLYESMQKLAEEKRTGEGTSLIKTIFDPIAIIPAAITSILAASAAPSKRKLLNTAIAALSTYAAMKLLKPMLFPVANTVVNRPEAQ